MSEREDVEAVEDVEALAEVLYHVTGMWAWPMRVEAASRILASSWLAAHDEAVRVSRVRLAGEVEAPECDHPGIEHGMWSHTGVCPACHKCKWIGHGPLCGDCYHDAGVRLAEEE